MKYIVWVGGTIIYEGKNNSVADRREQQFLDWGVKYHELHVNVGKPHFDMYICDKSYNAASFFHRTERNLP